MNLLHPVQRQVPAEMLLRGQVQNIVSAPRRILETMVRSWCQSFDALWIEQQGITAAQRLAKLGPAAAPLFAHSAAMVTFLLETIGDSDPALAATITSRIASMPATTVHEDGTVTID